MLSLGATAFLECCSPRSADKRRVRMLLRFEVEAGSGVWPGHVALLSRDGVGMGSSMGLWSLARRVDTGNWRRLEEGGAEEGRGF